VFPGLAAMLIGGSGLMLGIDGNAVFDWVNWSVI
jgi:hypothetical protein